MEGHAVHSDLIYATVIELIAFPQEVRPRLRIRNHCDHSVRRTHDAIQSQRAHLQSGFARRKIFLRPTLLAGHQGLERIAARVLDFDGGGVVTASSRGGLRKHAGSACRQQDPNYESVHRTHSSLIPFTVLAERPTAVSPLPL